MLLPKLVGEARARSPAVTAEPLVAETAARWGLICSAVADDSKREEAMALAARLTQGPTIRLGLTKRAIQAAADPPFDVHLDLKRGLQRAAAGTPSYAVGASAFLEKRATVFRGVR